MLRRFRIDRVITVDEWATDTIRAVLPDVAEFQVKADVEIKRRYGYAVEHIRSPHTFESLFYMKMSRHSKRAGQTRGWPFQRGCWANSFLKMEPFRKAIMRQDVQYIGIASDETKRIQHHSKQTNRRIVEMPLVQAGWTEQDCMKWGVGIGLLSPVYTTFARDGCWFCCNQPVERVRWLRKKHPELWKLMLQWDKDSPVQFKAHYSVNMLEERFRLEEQNLCPIGKGFRWERMRDGRYNPPIRKFNTLSR